MSISIRADTSSLDSLMDSLGEGVEDATRPAAQAGAQVLYERVKSNVGAMGKKTGNLDRSIYQKFSESNSSAGRATYHISWNHIKAPHGHLLEFGWWQRYAVEFKNGRFVTLVRPEKQGTPKPKRRASQAEKDAYYVPRPGGPRFRPGSAFVRSAEASFPQAVEAAKAELLKRVMK